jgi:hypothetical protein
MPCCATLPGTRFAKQIVAPPARAGVHRQYGIAMRYIATLDPRYADPAFWLRRFWDALEQKQKFQVH